MRSSALQDWSGKILRVLLPLVISGLAIWFVFREIDLQTLAAAFQSINAGVWIWCCLAFLIGLLLRVWSWHLILGRQFPFKRVFFVMNAGYLLNNVLPFRLGEIGRAVLLGSSQVGKPGVLEVLSSIVVERIYDIFLASVFFLSCLPWVVVSQSARTWALVMLVIVLIIFILVVWATRRRSAIIAWMERYKGKGRQMIVWLTPKLDALLRGFSVLTNTRLFLSSFSLMLLSWILSMLQQYPLQLSLIPEGEWWWVVFVLAAGAFGGALPSAPAAMGVFEAAIVGAFLLLGVEQSRALAYALIVHAIQFSFSSIFGLIGLITEGQSIGNLYRKARQQKGAVKETTE